MTTILKNPVTLFLSRWILGGVFIVASIEKILMPELFAANIEAYHLLPLFIINIVSLLLPWIELACGMALIFGYRERASALLISILLAVFIIAISAAVLRGFEIDCGCFGSAKTTPVSWAKVAEDIGLLILAIHIIFFGKRDGESHPVQSVIS